MGRGFIEGQKTVGSCSFDERIVEELEELYSACNLLFSHCHRECIFIGMIRTEIMNIYAQMYIIDIVFKKHLSIGRGIVIR